jgi:hypothetical protein
MVNMSISKEDKLGLINVRIRDLEINKYNLELTLLEESASISPNTADIQSINLEIDVFETKISALQDRYKVVQAE